MRNSEILDKLQKNFFGVNSLKTGGQMNPTQSARFIQMMKDEPTILNDTRTVRMNSDNQTFDKIGFGQRVLRAAEEFTELPENQRVKPSTGKVSLSAKEVIAEVNISDDTIENNIEGNNITDTIVKLLAQQAALDVEELIINGDVDSADSYLALIDGLLKQTQSHIIDLEGAALTKDAFKNAIKAVPSRYRKRITDNNFYISHNNVMEWKDSIVGRQTALGDRTLSTAGHPNAYGAPVKGCANLNPYDFGLEGAEVSNGILVIMR